MYNVEEEEWGYLREHSTSKYINVKDPDTGLHRTGLDKYLEVIFPYKKWIYNKRFYNKEKTKYRIPDYRCDELRIIVEFDGFPHYKNPDTIKRDEANKKFYSSAEYTLVRIPYFIQLTNEVVEILFGKEVKDNLEKRKIKLFNPLIPSMGVKGQNTPAFLCPEGFKRMAKEFKKFPQQYKVNIEALKAANDEYLTAASLLEEEYNKQ